MAAADADPPNDTAVQLDVVDSGAADGATADSGAADDGGALPDVTDTVSAACTVLTAAKKEASADAVDCGSAQKNRADAKQVYACAAAALLAGKPFIAHFVSYGIDSELEDAIVGMKDGAVITFAFDSYPYGNKAVYRTPCLGPYLAQHNGLDTIWLDRPQLR